MWERQQPLTGALRAQVRTEAVRLYASGLSLKATAKAIDRPQLTVPALLREAGYPIRSRGGKLLGEKPMIKVWLYIPADVHDALTEYAQLRSVEFNDAFRQIIGKAVGIEWSIDGRKMPVVW